MESKETVTENNVAEKQVLLPEELQALQRIHTKLHELTSRVGYLELEKQGLLKEIESAQLTSKEFNKNLNKKYGEIQIDIVTGEYKKAEPLQPQQ